MYLLLQKIPTGQFRNVAKCNWDLNATSRFVDTRRTTKLHLEHHSGFRVFINANMYLFGDYYWII